MGLFTAGKVCVQENCLLVENDAAASLWHYRSMAKGKKSGSENAEDDLGPLRLAEWLEAAKVKKAWLARETGIGPSYITQLCDPEGYPGKEASFKALRTIAKALSRKLGYPVTVEELHEAPPSPREIARSRQMAERMVAARR